MALWSRRQSVPLPERMCYVVLYLCEFKFEANDLPTLLENNNHLAKYELVADKLDNILRIDGVEEPGVSSKSSAHE